MPRLKTHSGSKKRFNLTKTGKVKMAKAFKSHILTRSPPSVPVTCVRAAMPTLPLPAPSAR